jgi:hypothetical protein
MLMWAYSFVRTKVRAAARAVGTGYYLSPRNSCGGRGSRWWLVALFFSSSAQFQSEWGSVPQGLLAHVPEPWVPRQYAVGIVYTLFAQTLHPLFHWSRFENLALGWRVMMSAPPCMFQTTRAARNRSSLLKLRGVKNCGESQHPVHRYD